jgi:CheY-like chemotaxis protein
MRSTNFRRPVEILLVEDDPTEVYLIKEAFAAGTAPVHLSVVEDGEAVAASLRCAGRYAAAGQPDLILLSLYLPKRDGQAVLGDLKGDPALCSIPVLVLSSSHAPHRRRLLRTIALRPRDENLSNGLPKLHTRNVVHRVVNASPNSRVAGLLANGPNEIGMRRE